MKILILGRLTSFKQAPKQASFVDVYIKALSSPRIILFGTRSNVHGLKQTLSAKTKNIINNENNGENSLQSNTFFCLFSPDLI